MEFVREYDENHSHHMPIQLNETDRKKKKTIIKHFMCLDYICRSNTIGRQTIPICSIQFIRFSWTLDPVPRSIFKSTFNWIVDGNINVAGHRGTVYGLLVL